MGMIFGVVARIMSGHDTCRSGFGWSYCSIKARIVLAGKLTPSNFWPDTCSNRGETPEGEVPGNDIGSVL
jgi:hypothetical protein